MIRDQKLDYWRGLLHGILLAGEDNPEQFAQVVALLDEARDALRVTAAELRRPNWTRPTTAYSWQEIADALGVPKSTVVNRYRLREGDPTP